MGFANGVVNDLFFVSGYDIRGLVVAQVVESSTRMGIKFYIQCFYLLYSISFFCLDREIQYWEFTYIYTPTMLLRWTVLKALVVHLGKEKLSVML